MELLRLQSRLKCIGKIPSIILQALGQCLSDLKAGIFPSEHQGEFLIDYWVISLRETATFATDANRGATPGNSGEMGTGIHQIHTHKNSEQSAVEMSLLSATRCFCVRCVLFLRHFVRQ